MMRHPPAAVPAAMTIAQVTRISSRHCQRESCRPVPSLRVTSADPATSTSINAQVNTMVALSLTNPCCQKIHWSGLRRMGASRVQAPARR